jgi:hypothetical protein
MVEAGVAIELDEEVMMDKSGNVTIWSKNKIQTYQTRTMFVRQ